MSERFIPTKHGSTTRSIRNAVARIAVIAMVLVLVTSSASMGVAASLGGNGAAAGAIDTNGLAAAQSAGIEYSNFSISESDVAFGTGVAITVDVENSGSSPETFNATLRRNGSVREYRNGTLQSGNETTLRFHVAEGVGTHEFTVNGEGPETLTVRPAWYQFGAAPDRTGATAGTHGPIGNVAQQWNETVVDSTTPVDTSPAIVDGTVYVASGGTLVALDADTGNRLWDEDVGGELTSPSVSDGRVYVGSKSAGGSSGAVHAVDAQSGNEVWNESLDGAVSASPHALAPFVVLAGTENGTVYAIDAATGDVGWTFDAGDTVYAPIAEVGGQLFVGTDGGDLYAVDSGTGTENWNVSTPGGIQTAPSVDWNTNTVVVADAHGNLVGFDAADGTQRWNAPVTSGFESSPTIDAVGGTVYVSDIDGNLHAYNATNGDHQWDEQRGGTTDSFPSAAAFAPPGLLAAGNTDGNVYGLDPATGNELWSFSTGDAVHSSPAIYGGTVYVGSDDGKLYALTDASSGGGGDGAGSSFHDLQAIDATDGDGTVGDGDTIEVRANVTDPDGVARVGADVSLFGGPTPLQLTKVPGTKSTYNVTFQVDAANASVNGDHEITVFYEDGQGDTNHDLTPPLTLDVSGNDFTVHSKSVEQIGGPGDSLPSTTVEFDGGLVQVQLKAGPDYDLESNGADGDTEYRINATINGTTPRVLLGAGNDVMWTRTQNPNGSWTVSITAKPTEVQSKHPTPAEWDGSQVANTRHNATVQLAIGSLDGLSQERRQQLDGSIYATDAQGFGQPAYVEQDDSVSVHVEAPHFEVDGSTQNTGFFDTLLPDALLNEWGVSSASDLQVNAMGTPAQPATATDVPEGIRLYIPLHYSAGDVTISSAPSGRPVITNQSVSDADDDGVVETDGESVTVSADVTADAGVDRVSVDASALGAGSDVELTPDGGDTYSATITVDETNAAADGTYRMTITAADDDGNETTAETGSFELDLRAPSEDEVVNASAGVDLWQRSILPLRADPTVGAVQVDNANWRIDVSMDGFPSGQVPLNKDPIAVYDNGTAIPVSFDDGRATAEGQLRDADVQLVAARLEGDQAATLSGLSSLEDLRDLLDEESANENASFELVESAQLGSGGDGDFTYTPSKPGQYVLFLATNESGGFAVDGDGNVSLASQTTIVGVDQVAVQRENSTVSTDQDAYAAGDDVTFDADTTGVVQTSQGENVTHAVILYDEGTFVDETFTIEVDGELTEDFDVSENVTLRHTIAEVNGVAGLDGEANFFGVTAESRRASGLLTMQTVLDFVAENTSVSGSLIPKTDTDGDTVWNASVTVVNGTAEDTVVVETVEDWPEGEYRWIHVATDDSGTEFASNTGTVEVNETATPAEIEYSNLAVSPADGGTLNVTERATASVDVENTGGLAGDYEATLFVDGTQVDAESGTLDGGESTTLSLDHAFTSAGTYNVTLVAGDQSATSNVTVVVPDTTPPVIKRVSPAEGKVPYGTAVRVDVTDADSDVASTYAEVDGQVQNLTGQSNTRTIATAGIEEGTQTVTVNATDEAGNEITKTFTFDFVSAPKITSVSPTGTVNETHPWINVTYADDRHGANETGVDPNATTLTIDGQPVDLSDAAVKDSSELKIQASSPPPEGTHTARVSVTDEAGHTTVKSWKFTVDRTGPSISLSTDRKNVSAERPTVVSIDVDDDDLESAIYEIRNDSGLQDSIDVTDAAASTDSAIKRSLDGSDLADGEYTLVVDATDDAGNRGTANVSVTVDNSEPTIEGDPLVGNDTALVDGGSVLTNDSARFLVNASDLTVIVSAEYSVRRAASGSSTGLSGSFQPNQTETIDLSSLSSGEYAIRVTLVDDVGNEQRATLAPTIDLDRTPPGLSTEIASKDGGELWVNVTSSEPLQGAPTATIENDSDFADSVDFGKSNGGTTFNGTVDKPDANGEYDVTVTGTDLAGNVGTDVEDTTLDTVEAGTTGNVTVINERTGTFLHINLSETIQSDSLVTLSGSDNTAFSLPPGLESNRFETLEFNNSLIENVTIGIRAKPGNKPAWASNNDVNIRFWNTSTKQWETVTPTVFHGSYDIPEYTGQHDGAAYWIAERDHLSEHGVMANDTQPPSIEFDELQEGYEFGADNETVAVNATLTDDEMGVNESNIELLINGTDETGEATISSIAGQDGNFTLAHTITDLSPGDARNVTIVAEDDAGNRTVETVNFSIADDTDEPSVTVVEPTDGQEYPIGTEDVTLEVTYDDGDGSGIDTSNVTVFRNDTEITGAADIDETSLEVTATGFDPGHYDFTVNVSDRAGNHNESVVDFSIAEDTEPPKIDIPDVDAGGALPANTTYQEITADVNDSGVGVDDTTIEVYFDETTVTSDATVTDLGGENFSVTYNATGLTWDGEYNLTIVANDTEGNQASATEVFNVSDDTTKPTVAIVSPADGEVANTTDSPNDTATATLEFELDDDVSGVDTDVTALQFDGDGVTDNATLTTDAVTYTTDALDPGTYAYTLSVRDNASNANSTSGTFEIVTDTTAPTAALTGPTSANTGQSVTLDASGSTDDGAIANYTWDFGDGSSDTTTSATTTHSYSSAGSYTVTVTVTDKSGNSDTETHSITVSAAGGGTGSTGGSGGARSDDAPSGTTATTSGSAKATVSAVGRQVSVNVEGAQAGDSVSVERDATEVDGEVRRHGSALEGIETTFTDATDFDMEIEASSGKPDPSVPDPPSERGAVGYIDVRHSASDDAVGEVRFTFRVTQERLDDAGIGADEVVLYRYSDDGEWSALETEPAGTADDGSLRFRATSPGLSVFAIGGPQAQQETPDEPTETTTEPPGTTAPPTEEPTETTTIAEPGGFGNVYWIIAFLVILVATIGGLYWYRQQ